ncbi:MAG: ATP-binding protein [Kofleriaceae bacterium]
MAAPLRTLSARILLGFAALIVTFGITTVLIVRYMDDVGVEIGVIRTGYLRLALTTKDLARKQDDLRSYVADELAGDASPRRVELRLRSLRGARDRLLAEAATIVGELGSVPARHARRIDRTREQVDALRLAVEALAPRYQALLTSPPLDGVAGPAAPDRALASDALAALKLDERSLSAQATDLALYQERAVTSTAKNLEYNEERLRLYTILLGVSAVVVGLLITIWATLTLRPLRRLREGARRIGAGDHGGRIDERGPAEVADLAREFNAMAHAVEERQRELVRSERLAAIGKMAAMITHEVRNPLSSIALNTELLGDELDALAASPEARELCRAITREVDRLTGITEDYLALARAPKPRTAPQALGELVTATAEFLREELTARGVALELELAADLPPAPIDAGQLRQCLINLVRNAAEALADRPGGTIRLVTRRLEAGLAIEVIDDGPGIPADLRPRLFDPFFTTKAGGTGLGLAISQQIARDHGGQLQVESDPGAGATFRVIVPLASDATEVAQPDDDRRP